jgi:hypothetical protein
MFTRKHSPLRYVSVPSVNKPSLPTQIKVEVKNPPVNAFPAQKTYDEFPSLGSVVYKRK